MRPKAVGGWNLHNLSLQMKDLEHFVIFSSIVSSIGHQGASSSFQILNPPGSDRGLSHRCCEADVRTTQQGSCDTAAASL